ncbi:MAG: hypothetical protein ACYSWU_01755 [Planctomycetota bacterium]
MGDSALPALEKELRLGIPFSELNRLLGEGRSRRCAVVQVLARIPIQRSTQLLVASLADPSDTYGMRVVTLNALAQRRLSADQVLEMLANYRPDVVLAGIPHARQKMTATPIKEAVERIFDRGHAVAQFRNKNGASTASADALWEVRLAAGQALQRDMIPEMRSRAKAILATLQAEATHPTKPDTPARMSYASQAEQTICGCLKKLSALGEPVRDLVEHELKQARGDYAKVLDMALLRLGDKSRLPQVASHLVASSSPTIRFCAAVTLRVAGDPSATAALRQALRDPYRRQDGSCVRIGDGEIHPIRIVAADALVDLGEDPKAVREELKKQR